MLACSAPHHASQLEQVSLAAGQKLRRGLHPGADGADGRQACRGRKHPCSWVAAVAPMDAQRLWVVRPRPGCRLWRLHKAPHSISVASGTRPSASGRGAKLAHRSKSFGGGTHEYSCNSACGSTSVGTSVAACAAPERTSGSSRHRLCGVVQCIRCGPLHEQRRPRRAALEPLHACVETPGTNGYPSLPRRVHGGKRSHCCQTAAASGDSGTAKRTLASLSS